QSLPNMLSLAASWRPAGRAGRLGAGGGHRGLFPWSPGGWADLGGGGGPGGDRPQAPHLGGGPRGQAGQRVVPGGGGDPQPVMGEPQAVHGVRRRYAGAVAGPAGEGDRWRGGRRRGRGVKWPVGGRAAAGTCPMASAHQCRPPAGSRVRPLQPASMEVIGSRVLVTSPVSVSSWSVTSITVRPSGGVRNPPCQP